MKLILKEFAGFYHYDKYHLRKLTKLLRDTCLTTQQELKMLFYNNTLTKQELDHAIREWIRKRSAILEVSFTIYICLLTQKLN